MKKSKKNKRNKNKKSKNNEDIDKNEKIDDYNAAPILNQTNGNENLEEDDEENLAPAIDNQSKDFNNYIKEFNKKREGMLEIPLNNSLQIKTKKNHNTLNFMRKLYVNNLQLNFKYKDCFILLEIKSNILKVVLHQFYAVG